MVRVAANLLVSGMRVASGMGAAVGTDVGTGVGSAVGTVVGAGVGAVVGLSSSLGMRWGLVGFVLGLDSGGAMLTRHSRGPSVSLCPVSVRFASARDEKERLRSN